MKLRRLALALLPALVACEAGPPPYGFATGGERSYELESRGQISVDGQPVEVLTYAAFRLAAEPVDKGRASEIVVYLERYYQSVERDEGRTEVGISDQGVLVRGGEQGELRLAPDEPTPTASSVLELLERPLASAVLDSEGELQGSPFHAYDPLLAEVDPLDWFLLAAPLLPDGPAGAWTGSREVPRIGQYRLGVQLPLRYERVDSAGAGERIRAEGYAHRDDLEIVDGFSGVLELEYMSHAELGPGREVVATEAQLDVTFDASNGSRIQARHRFQIRCRDCPGDVNSESSAPDQETR